MDSFLLFSLSAITFSLQKWFSSLSPVPHIGESSFIQNPNIIETRSAKDDNAYSQLIGNTPLVELKALSKILGRRVLVKMESMNPGGTGKDRAAKFMVREAFGELQEKRVAVEGTSGSTGIALAYLCRSYGRYIIILFKILRRSYSFIRE